MKINLVSAILLTLLVDNLSAATFIVSNVVNGDGTTDSLYQDSDGSLLNGGLVSIGYFPAGYLVQSNTSNIEATIANFTSVTSFATGTNSSSLNGSFAGYVEGPAVLGSTITAGNALLGRELYIFAGNAATLATSTKFGLKQIGTILDDDPFANQYTANPFGGDAPVIGKTGSYTGDAGGVGVSTFTTLQLVQVVPEPSSAFLASLGVLGLLRRRRN
jgi:PEP-CTERM motif